MAYKASGPYETYAQILADWPTALGSASQWFLWFDLSDIPALQTDIQKKLREKEAVLGPSGWILGNDTVDKLLDWKLQLNADSSMGCVFARQVNLPGYSFEAGNSGLNYGGYTAPATSNSRSTYQKLNITFLETNASFVDFVVKPWMILSSYYGLVARGPNSDKNVKCSWCDICFLARTSPGVSPAIRKVYRFTNLVPVNIQGEQYSYMSDDMKYTSVDFVYDQYYIQEANTPGLLNYSR
jgi:hypothetical protein